MYYQKVIEAKEYLFNKFNIVPDTAVILGSGLGSYADEIQEKTVISYSDIPNFPISTAKGHKGNIVFGKIRDRYVVVFQGRFHIYEGYSVNEVVFGVRTVGLLGVKNIIITNAAGDITNYLQPGDLMVINDHINLTGENPAIGIDSLNFGERFFDMTYAYDRELIEKSKYIFKKNNIEYKEGVYAYLKGPSFETPAEIKMLSILGANAVGMSTVPEVIAARQMNIKVFAISCITNMAAGIIDKKLTDDEVFEVSKKAENKFTRIISDMIEVA